jgi:hypothetical protein
MEGWSPYRPRSPRALALQRNAKEGHSEGRGVVSTLRTSVGSPARELLGLDGGPARGRDFQHPGIIESILARVELRIGPHRLELDGTDAVAVARIGDVDRAADRWDLAGKVRLAVIHPRDVENLLEALAALGPTFHDLDAVEIARCRVLDRPHREGWRPLVLRHWLEIAPHGHALRIGDAGPGTILDPVGNDLPELAALGEVLILVIVPAAKKSQLDPRSAGGKGFLALHRLEQRGAGVLLGPHPGQPRRVLEPDIEAGI